MPWRSSSGAETSNRPMNGARCAIATPAGVFRSRSIDHGTGKDFLCPGHAGSTADARPGAGGGRCRRRHAGNGLCGMAGGAGCRGGWQGARGGGRRGRQPPPPPTRPPRPTPGTARLDGGADLKAAPPPGLGAGWGHVLARLQNAQIRRAAGIGAFDAVAGAPGQSDPSAPSTPSGPSDPWSAGDALQLLTAAQGAGAALAPAAGAALAQQPQSAGATAGHGAAALATGAAPAARLAEAAPAMPASAPGP